MPELPIWLVPELPIWQFDVLLLILVVVFAVVALSIRNLMGAAVVFGAYSFMMCLIWAGMGAVDVAFTEAAVGAGVSTVFVVSTLYNTGATMHRRAGGVAFKLFVGVVVTVAGEVGHHGLDRGIAAAMEDQPGIAAEQARGVDTQGNVAAHALIGVVRDHCFGVGIVPQVVHRAPYAAPCAAGWRLRSG